MAKGFRIVADATPARVARIVPSLHFAPFNRVDYVDSSLCDEVALTIQQTIEYAWGQPARIEERY
jgi:hypothetical protein